MNLFQTKGGLTVYISSMMIDAASILQLAQIRNWCKPYSAESALSFILFYFDAPQTYTVIKHLSQKKCSDSE